ncbi:10321_t:CDS:2, partial [Racocetra fulgida]
MNLKTKEDTKDTSEQRTRKKKYKPETTNSPIPVPVLISRSRKPKEEREKKKEDVKYIETKSSDHSNYKTSTSWTKPFVPTFSAPPETNDVSVPTGTPIIPGLLPGMTEIPAVPGQDIAAANAILFASDIKNSNREIEGALIETSFKSTIGVLLDDISESFGMREKVANYYLKQNTDFWIQKAHMQTIFTENRQIFRNFYYSNKKQLTLPPEEVWEFNLGKARRTKIGVHDYIAMDVEFYSVLVTDAKTINRSEPALDKIGGKWSDHWILPVDPEFLLQRTGYACVNENSFPKHTVESENVWVYYDDTCEAEPPNKAKKYRFGNHTSSLPDLVGVRKNLLEQTRVAYRYYGENTDLMKLHFYRPGRKVGFCLQTTWRYFNTEYTYLNTPYDTCAYQGISVGWGDDYVAGLGCQWIDVTDLPAQKAILSDSLNPD